MLDAEEALRLHNDVEAIAIVGATHIANGVRHPKHEVGLDTDSGEQCDAVALQSVGETVEGTVDASFMITAVAVVTVLAEAMGDLDIAC